MKKIVRRNAPCPCGSGLKFKRCCLKQPPAPIVEPLQEPGLVVIGNRIVRGHAAHNSVAPVAPVPGPSAAGGE